MNNTLESYKAFPYVAWTLVIGFALFTVMLSMRLHDELSTLDNSMGNLEVRIDRLERLEQEKSE
jgi:hypothetical protein